MRRPKSQTIEEQRFHVAIRGLFALFFFLYFYRSQDAAVALAQHQLSLGQTSYHPLVGAVVLTALLMGLQALVLRVAKIAERLYILTFVPSAVCAVLLTAFVPYYRPSALVLTLVVLIVSAVIICRRPQRTERKPMLSVRLLHCLMLFAYMGFAGNTNDVLNYEVRTSRLLSDCNYEQALEVGKKSLSSSERLVAMRAYAMSHLPGGLGEQLFTRPLESGGSRQLFLLPADTSSVLFPPDSLYSFLSGEPADSLELGFTAYSRDVFERFAQVNPAGPSRDYWLCALLLDKDLQAFAQELPKYYEVADSLILPKAYAEALVLVNRQQTDTLLHCANPNVLENYLDFKDKERKISPSAARRNLLYKEYGNTYWWYYFYGGELKEKGNWTNVF